MIWKKKFTLADLNASSKGTMVEHLGIRFTSFDDESLTAEMPVDHRTLQPAKLLHGGASVALAETLGSVGANLCLQDANQQPVGLEINANHIRSATNGHVTGVARALHIGRTTHVWEIQIHNEQQKLVCISRLTVAVKTLA